MTSEEFSALRPGSIVSQISATNKVHPAVTILEVTFRTEDGRLFCTYITESGTLRVSATTFFLQTDKLWML